MNKAIGICLGSTSKKGLSLVSDPLLPRFLDYLDCLSYSVFLFQYRYEDSILVNKLLKDHPFIYPYPTRYVTNIAHLSFLLKKLNVYLGPEGGTTRVALHEVPKSFVYRNSFDSHELMSSQICLSPFSSRPVVSILSLNDRLIWEYLFCGQH